MHEFSIALALIDLVRQHAPPGTLIRSIQVRAGPLRAIEPTAMQLAWQAATAGTELAQTRLDLEIPPWTLLCPDCGRTWTSQDLYELCSCGSARSRPVGGDELLLVSLHVDPAADPIPPSSTR